MPKEHKYQGETFLLDDSKGCYIEVNYRDLVAKDCRQMAEVFKQG